MFQLKFTGDCVLLLQGMEGFISDDNKEHIFGTNNAVIMEKIN